VVELLEVPEIVDPIKDNIEHLSIKKVDGEVGV
jgi:hypothetical protein